MICGCDEKLESLVKAKFLKREIFVLGLIADKLFDIGSGLLAHWIGVPVR